MYVHTVQPSPDCSNKPAISQKNRYKTIKWLHQLWGNHADKRIKVGIPNAKVYPKLRANLHN